MFKRDLGGSSCPINISSLKNMNWISMFFIFELIFLDFGFIYKSYLRISCFKNNEEIVIIKRFLSYAEKLRYLPQY